MRALALQVAVAAAVGLVLAWFAGNVVENLQAKGLSSGYRFLFERAGFDVSETVPLPWREEGRWSLATYSSSGSYLLAFLTGLANTLKVGAVGCLAATVLGIVVALFAASPVSPLYLPATAYIRASRNVPLLLQLLLWYALLINLLPEVSASWRVGNVFLNNRGLFLPGPVEGEGGRWMIEVPELVFGGRNLRGGLQFTPEFVALTTGLTLYTASFIAELLRAAVASLPRGQSEAASALGLSRLQTFRLVLLPQAVRIAVPPLVSQYLNLVKNTSLAIAIGYPDLVAVGGTIINQTGQALEVVALWMAVYLTFSLFTSAVVNGWDARLRAGEAR